MKLTKEQAIALEKSRWWVGVSDHDIVMFQLFEPLLCTEWSVFHAAVSRVLGRGVFTHEFASSNIQHLQDEFLGDRPAPSMDEVLRMIPAEKLMLLHVDGDRPE